MIIAIVGYFLALVMGATLGLIGGGGSILTMPILTYIFKISTIEATAYSLFIVGVSSILGAGNYIKKGLVNFKIGFIFSVPAFIGVYSVRRFLMPSLPETIFNIPRDNFILIVFAVVMLLASYPMFKKEETKKGKEYKGDSKYILIVLEGLLVGSITGFVGAGGGFLIIPALNMLTGLKMKEAIGTSLFIISIKSLIGFVGDIQVLEGIKWGFLVNFTILSLIGILIGLKLSERISDDKLKKNFGIFIIILGSFIIFKQF